MVTDRYSWQNVGYGMGPGLGREMRTGKLTALAVRKLKAPGRYGDGGNLYLYVRANGARSWVLRYSMPGQKPRDMGLGTTEDVDLSAAREAARDARQALLQGRDPIAERQARRRASVQTHTFSEVASIYIAAHQASWKSKVHASQWVSTLTTYAYPVLGAIGVKNIAVEQILKVLEPIWQAKSETASRVRGRIESVLSYATAQGWRSGENPARWRGHLDHLLPKIDKAGTVEHHAALDWRACPAFMRKLEARAGAGAQALQFTVLCASRTAEVTGAVWKEFDFKAKVWTVPAVRMKSKLPHQVPLSPQVIKILRAVQLPDAVNDDFVFPGDKLGSSLSSGSMTAVLKRIGLTNITVHGFRSSFRDWVADATSHSRDVAEAALAHAVKDKTEAAYLRTKLLEKRFSLMEDWSSFLMNA